MKTPKRVWQLKNCWRDNTIGDFSWTAECSIISIKCTSAAGWSGCSDGMNYHCKWSTAIVGNPKLKIQQKVRDNAHRTALTQNCSTQTLPSLWRKPISLTSLKTVYTNVYINEAVSSIVASDRLRDKTQYYWRLWGMFALMFTSMKQWVVLGVSSVMECVESNTCV